MKKTKKVLDKNSIDVYNDTYNMEYIYFMSIDTQLLIIQLLDREIIKSNHIATLGYLADVKAAKTDFIQHAKTLGPQRQNVRRK